MAFVFDHNDPSNLGMFSKPGRFTSEKYIIFQKKDEIINNQRKFLKVTALPHLKVDFDSKEHAKNILDEEDEKPKTVQSTKSRSVAAPFSQQMSREEYYQVKSVKHPAPPFGFYNPKYHYVDRTPRTLFKYNMEKPKAAFFSTMTDWNAEEASRPLPDKPHRKIVGPAPFHQQKSRGTLLSPSNHPHEERFTYLEFPKNCTKSKKLLSIDMSKTLPRDDKLMFKSLEYSPDYEANFEVGKKRLGSCGAPFEKGTPRKPMFHISPCSNENYVDPAKSENLKFSKSQDTFFDKYLSRTIDEKSPLPSFMQKSVSSRLAVGTLRQKTLEINGFSDGRFQTVYSSFSPKKK